jgi:hypothetical protein
VDLGLLVVILERAPKLGRRGTRGHAGELLEDLLLRVEQIVELGYIEIAKGDQGHARSQAFCGP